MEENVAQFFKYNQKTSFTLPTIFADNREPLRRKDTFSSNEKRKIPVHPDDSNANDPMLPADYEYDVITPEVMESDYWGAMSYRFTGNMHIHAIVQNPLKPLRQMTAGGETAFHFGKAFAQVYNKAVMGMLHQWRISCLQLLDAVVQCRHYPIQSTSDQKA